MKEQGERANLTPGSDDGRGTPGAEDVDAKREHRPEGLSVKPASMLQMQKAAFPFQPQGSPKVEDSAAGSPLQRMASITNALVSQVCFVFQWLTV